MSISFTAKITAHTQWSDDGKLTEPFIGFESTLDLGSSRALRSIMKDSDNVDECSSITLTYEEAINWLAIACSRRDRYTLVGACLNYLIFLQPFTYNNDDSVNWVTVHVTWA